jgi:glycosyltransferase involved in cell wall biosynthesis
MRLFCTTGARVPSQAANAVQFLKMCAAFAANGHSVTATARAGEAGVDVYDSFGVDRTFTFTPVPAAAPRGVRTLAFELEVLRIARMLAPDHVFTRDVYAASVLSMHWPTTLELHRTMDGHPAELFALRAMVRRGRLRRVVMVSEGMARWYRAAVPGIVPFVAPGAADDPGVFSSSSSSSSSSLSSAALRVGYVGRIYAGRGAELLLALAAARPNFEFHFVGARSDDLGGRAPANVVIHAHVPHREVAARLQGFDVLVAPYQKKVFVDGGAETSAVMSPLKIFEYLASGRPVVCSDLPVLREVLDDDVAVLCAPDDVHAWARALDALVDVAARSSLGERGRARFLARHTWTARAQRVLA